MICPTSVIVIFTAIFGLVAALPVDVETAVRRSSAAGIQMWSGRDFTGNFYHYAAPEIVFDRCYDITGRFPPGTGGGLMSVKADSKNRCTLFPNKVCNPGTGSDQDALWVEGSYYDLSNPEEGWGERAASFSCKACPQCNN